MVAAQRLACCSVSKMNLNFLSITLICRLLPSANTFRMFILVMCYLSTGAVFFSISRYAKLPSLNKRSSLWNSRIKKDLFLAI